MSLDFIIQLVFVLLAGYAWSILDAHFRPVFNSNFLDYRLNLRGFGGGVVSEFKQAAVSITLAVIVLAFVVFGIWYTTQPSAEMTRIEDKLDRIITLLEGQNGKPTPTP